MTVNARHARRNARNAICYKTKHARKYVRKTFSHTAYFWKHIRHAKKNVRCKECMHGECWAMKSISYAKRDVRKTGTQGMPEGLTVAGSGLDEDCMLLFWGAKFFFVYFLAG
jgi:hypothetical protein